MTLETKDYSIGDYNWERGTLVNIPKYKLTARVEVRWLFNKDKSLNQEQVDKTIEELSKLEERKKTNQFMFLHTKKDA